MMEATESRPALRAHRGALIRLARVGQLASILPVAAVAPIARLAGLIHYHIAPGKRRALRDNISQADELNNDTPPWRPFQSHIQNILELLRAMGNGAARVHLRVDGAVHIDQALAAGRGLILTTLHTGNWELSGLSLAACGYPLTTVAGEQLCAGWSDELKGFKDRCGIHTVSPHDNMRALHRALAANRVLVLHLDGDVYEGGIDTTLLGRSVRLPRGPAALARVMKAPVAFAYCRRCGDGALKVVVEAPVAPPQTRMGERELTLRLGKRMEKCIVDAPGEWCIFRKL